MRSDVTTAVRASNPSRQILSTENVKSSGSDPACYAFLGLFAVALAAVTYKHELYLDEAQAWLIARDSRNLLDMFHRLQYEGHPALWYLVIYLPSHLSSHMRSIQGINYILAVGMAWLILSERRLPFVFRVLLVFSGSVFFYMGVVARSYMLAGVLLIAAARCLMATPRRHWLGMTLLGLAINSHAFAIPVAAGIFVWLYWLGQDQNWSVAAGKLKEWRFWASSAVLGAASMVACFTARPAPDIYTPQYQQSGATMLDYLVLGTGATWHHFVPLPLGILSASSQELLAPSTRPSLLAACLTIALWLLAVFALTGRRSRWFMVSVSLAWMAAVWATVHTPTPFHASFLFVAYIVALTMSSEDVRRRRRLPSQYSQLVLFLLLSMQVSICALLYFQEYLLPFSGAEPTAQWLASTGLAMRPLVIEPDAAGPAILGYTGIDSAYFPSCHCRGSFVVFRQGRELYRQVTAAELHALRREFGSAPVLITYRKLAKENLEELGLRFLYASPHGWYWQHEDVFVYDSEMGPSVNVSGAK